MQNFDSYLNQSMEDFYFGKTPEEMQDEADDIMNYEYDRIAEMDEAILWGL